MNILIKYCNWKLHEVVVYYVIIKQMENYTNTLLRSRWIQIIIIEVRNMNMYYSEMEMVNGISLSLNDHQFTHFMDDIDGMEVKIYYQDILTYIYI